MERIEIPTGAGIAMVAPDWTLTFDELHSLRRHICAELRHRAPERPNRIVGCLEDSETTLLAFLTLTEISDFMPLNPGLSDSEIQTILADNEVSLAVVSTRFIGEKTGLFGTIPVLDWKDFPLAVRRKIVLELVGPPGVLQVRDRTGSPGEDYDCLIGEKMRRERELLYDEP